LHDALLTDLKRRGIPYIHSRMDKPSTIRRGWPDVTAMLGIRVCCIELKAKGGALSEDQKTVITELQTAGVPVLVSSDLAESINFVKQNLLP